MNGPRPPRVLRKVRVAVDSATCSAVCCTRAARVRSEAVITMCGERAAPQGPDRDEHLSCSRDLILRRSSELRKSEELCS